MKKAKLVAALMFSGVLALAGCKGREKNVAPEDQTPADQTPGGDQTPSGGDQTPPAAQPTLSIDKVSVSIKPGETVKITASAANGTGDVIFSSSDESVATVDPTGLVTGVAEGPAVITASYSGLTKTCTVEVVAPEAKVVKSISLSPASLALDPYDVKTGEITPIVEADEGVDTTVSWVSSDTSVVTVSKASGTASEKITVTVVAPGTATITATCGGKQAVCDVSVSTGNPYLIANMYENSNITEFKSNVAKGTTVFKGGTSEFIEVGDENGFVMKPSLDLVEKESGDEAPTATWPYAFQFSIKEMVGENVVDVNASDVVVYDQTNVSFDFLPAARNRTFVLDVYPGGLSSEQLLDEEYHSIVKAKVYEGYNVYDADRLAYFNDPTFYGAARQNGSLRTGAEYNQGWIDFRTSKGLSTTYVAPRILLQSNIVIQKENLPDVMFLSESDGVEASQIGKMVDSTDVYARYADGFTFNGNYFNLNTNSVPKNGNKWNPSDGVSHSTLFKVAEIRSDASEDSSLTFKNCTLYGNAPRDTVSGGEDGLIFFKVQNYHDYNALKVYSVFDNFNVTRSCITFYAEYGPTDTTIRHCRVSEGYSNAIYMHQNGDLHIVDSELTNFGGPIIITGGNTDTITGFHITTDTTSKLENWVTGDEPWFMTTHANTAIPAIKGADALPNAFGKTFLKDTEETEGLMNFIAVNRGSNCYLTFDYEDEPDTEKTIGYNKDSADCATIEAYLAAGAVRFNSSNGTAFLYDGTMGSVTGPVSGKFLTMAQNMGEPFGVVGMVFELIDLA